MLVAQSTGHQILLPENGDLTLGRLDPVIKIKPDVDLTSDDRLEQGVSRMHASVDG